MSVPLRQHRNSLLRYCVCISFVIANSSGYSQSEIPLGTWRLHPSYNNIGSLALGSKKIYAAAQNGIVFLDRSENSISTYTKMNGLTGGEITYVNFDNQTDKLLIAYADGKFDVIKDETIKSFDPSKNSPLTGSKKINHISIHGILAYLSTDYGVVIFDLVRNDIKETWRDIGAGGQTLQIFQSTFLNDSIFLGTSKGVLAGGLNKNLLDFNFWRRFDAGEFDAGIRTVATFNGKVYAAIETMGLYHYEFGEWTKESFLQNESFRSLNASSISLLITSRDRLFRLSSSDILSEIDASLIEQPNMALEEFNGQLWIADGRNGIVSNPSAEFINYLPNGPSNSRVTKLSYNDKVIYALGGGYTSPFLPLNNAGLIDMFSGGSWSTQSSSMLDLTDIAFDLTSNESYLSSFGYGLEERKDQLSVKIFNDSNSPLVNSSASLKSVNVTSIKQSARGLWVANYGASKPLHLLTQEKSWESYSFPETASRYPLKLAIDFDDNVWMVLSPQQGGGVLVFDKRQSKSRYLTDISELGGLPSKAANAIAVDRDGSVWLGTDEGICYFANASEVFTNGINATKPIFENRFLLRDEKITAIAVDGGNRKWIGTERGLWLFNPSGEELIYNFTARNSPLPSDLILDITINAETGEVFFATEQGMVSFRADATESSSRFQSIKIFPNPVTPDFNGTVAISGLATDAIVKITDISGKLIWQTQANGGTASWNVRDYSGKRAASGVYLVFCSAADGAESVVGKIAVVQ